MRYPLNVFRMEDRYFEKHKEELRRDYLGQTVVIKRNKFLGAFAGDMEAIDYCTDTLHLKPGTYMVRPVTAEDPPVEYLSHIRF